VSAFGEYVYGIDPATGRVFWEHAIGHAITRIIITDTHIFVLGKVLACLTYPHGQIIWQAQHETYGAAFLLAGDKLFIGAMGEVSCHSAANGALLWTNPFKGRGMSGVALGTPHNVMQIDHGR
jgi:outer membrane protein assembly factor BamB